MTLLLMKQPLLPKLNIAFHFFCTRNVCWLSATRCSKFFPFGFHSFLFYQSAFFMEDFFNIPLNDEGYRLLSSVTKQKYGDWKSQCIRGLCMTANIHSLCLTYNTGKVNCINAFIYHVTVTRFSLKLLYLCIIFSQNETRNKSLSFSMLLWG